MISSLSSPRISASSNVKKIVTFLKYKCHYSTCKQKLLNYFKVGKRIYVEESNLAISCGKSRRYIKLRTSKKEVMFTENSIESSIRNKMDFFVIKF